MGPIVLELDMNIKGIMFSSGKCGETMFAERTKTMQPIVENHATNRSIKESLNSMRSMKNYSEQAIRRVR